MYDCIAAVAAALDAGKMVGLATVVGSSVGAESALGRKLVATADGTVVGTPGSGHLDRRIVDLVLERVSSGAPSALESIDLIEEEARGLGLPLNATLSVFVDVIQPPEVLVIVGGGHIAVPLSQMGKLLGFRVVVLDDRPEFANASRFP